MTQGGAARLHQETMIQLFSMSVFLSYFTLVIGSLVAHSSWLQSYSFLSHFHYSASIRKFGFSFKLSVLIL